MRSFRACGLTQASGRLPPRKVSLPKVGVVVRGSQRERAMGCNGVVMQMQDDSQKTHNHPERVTLMKNKHLAWLAVSSLVGLPAAHADIELIATGNISGGSDY
jgi:hypothetical protein